MTPESVVRHCITSTKLQHREIYYIPFIHSKVFTNPAKFRDLFMLTNHNACVQLQISSIWNEMCLKLKSADAPPMFRSPARQHGRRWDGKISLLQPSLLCQRREGFYLDVISSRYHNIYLYLVHLSSHHLRSKHVFF
jgi:hypothetical protein